MQHRRRFDPGRGLRASGEDDGGGVGECVVGTGDLEGAGPRVEGEQIDEVLLQRSRQPVDLHHAVPGVGDDQVVVPVAEGPQPVDRVLLRLGRGDGLARPGLLLEQRGLVRAPAHEPGKDLLDAVDRALVPAREFRRRLGDVARVEHPAQGAVLEGAGTDVVGERHQGVELILRERDLDHLGDLLGEVLALVEQEAFRLLFGHHIAQADGTPVGVADGSVPDGRYPDRVQVGLAPEPFPFFDEVETIL